MDWRLDLWTGDSATLRQSPQASYFHIRAPSMVLRGLVTARILRVPFLGFSFALFMSLQSSNVFRVDWGPYR